MIESLVVDGMIEEIDVPGKSWKQFRLTEKGQPEGEKALGSIEKEQIRQYVKDLSAFIHGLTFPQLVSAIYRAYPEMRVNSVFGNK